MKTLVTPLLWTSRRSASEYWLLAASGPVLLGVRAVGLCSLAGCPHPPQPSAFLVLAALVARYSRARSFGIADVVHAGARAGRLFSRGPRAAGTGRRAREAWSADHDHRAARCA